MVRIFEFRGLKGAAVPIDLFGGMVAGLRSASGDQKRVILPKRPAVRAPVRRMPRLGHAGGPDGPARQGGGRARWAERRRLFNTLTVAGGRATSARRCIGPPQFGHSKPATPNTRHNSRAHGTHLDLGCGCALNAGCGGSAASVRSSPSSSPAAVSLLLLGLGTTRARHAA